MNMNSGSFNFAPIPPVNFGGTRSHIPTMPTSGGSSGMRFHVSADSSTKGAGFGISSERAGIHMSGGPNMAAAAVVAKLNEKTSAGAEMLVHTSKHYDTAVVGAHIDRKVNKTTTVGATASTTGKTSSVGLSLKLKG